MVRVVWDILGESFHPFYALDHNSLNFHVLIELFSTALNVVVMMMTMMPMCPCVQDDDCVYFDDSPG